MAYFRWESYLDTGIGIIDAQHRRIVDYINELHEAIRASDAERVGAVIELLIDYTVTHFTFEESLLEKAGYGHSEAHSRVHAAFTGRIRDYKRRFEAGEDVSRVLLSDLRIWLTNHIQQEDRDYVTTVEPYLEGDHAKGWLPRTLARMFGGHAR